MMPANPQKAVYLIERSDGPNRHRNNYDFLRALAALMVIFSHSFTIAYGNTVALTLEPLMVATNQVYFGAVGLFIFFALSGFLITASFDRKPEWKAFFKNRCLRIFPGLLAVLLLGMFVLGPIMTNLPVLEYFKNIDTYQYLGNLSMLKWVDHLPGVFDNLPTPTYVNASLWSLRYEFYCYIMVAILGTLGLSKKRPAMLTVFLIITALHLYFEDPISQHLNTETGTLHLFKQFINFYLNFLAGSLVYVFRDKIRLNWQWTSLSIVILIVSMFSRFISTTHYIPEVITIIAGTYAVFAFAYSEKIRLYDFAKFGDFSYGLYIYSWPIQQMVCLWLGKTATWLNVFAFSMPFIIPCALLSWHFIEKQALSFKKKNVPSLQVQPQQA